MIDIDVIDNRRMVFIKRGDITHKILLWISGRDLMTQLAGDADKSYYSLSEIRKEFPESFVNQKNLQFMAQLMIIKTTWRWETQNSKSMNMYFGLTDFGSKILKNISNTGEAEIYIDNDDYALSS